VNNKDEMLFAVLAVNNGTQPMSMAASHRYDRLSNLKNGQL